jgi:hypothetical protein
MNEFEILKAMLERTGAELEITIWDVINKSLIEDKTNYVDYWFDNNLLDYVDNTKEFLGNY